MMKQNMKNNNLNNIIDIHNDLASNVLDATGKDITKRYGLYDGIPQIPGVVAHNNVDIPRLKEGNVKLIFATIFALDEISLNEMKITCTESYNFSKFAGMTYGIESARKQMAYYQDVLQKHADQLTLITNYSEYVSTIDSSKIGLLLHLEGIDYIDENLTLLDEFYSLGVRSLALTWRNNTIFASGNNSTGGLTILGEKLVRTAQEMGIFIDLAHSNEQTFWDLVKIVRAPVVVSHTLCKSICDVSRNLNDDQIKSIANLDGVIGLAAIPEYIGGNSIKDYVNHFKHIINLVGEDYVCFGTDFDGLVGADDTFIDNFDGSDKFPNVINGLIKAGFSKLTISKICHKNIERVMKEVLKNGN